MKIYTQSDLQSLRVFASRTLDDSLRRHRGKPVLLLLSGGSALEILHDIQDGSFGKNLTIGMLDERISVDPKENNFVALTRTDFYRHSQAAGAHFLNSVVLPDETPEGFALRMEKALREWKAGKPDGAIVITQGIGADGHTAGIMPYPENPGLFNDLFEDTKKWIVGYDAGSHFQYPRRATVTMPFLRNIVDTSIVYALGKSKQGALAKILAVSGNLHVTPARIIKEMRDVILFTDFHEVKN